MRSLAMVALRYIIIAFGALAVLLTALPLIPSNDSLIRIWDFPRVQLAVVLIVALLASPWVLPARDWRRIAFGGALTAALVWQAIAIWPYTPFAAKQAKPAVACAKGASISLLAANVLMHNTDAARLEAIVKRTDPDVILLVETDSAWEGRLAFLNASHRHAVRRPRDNTYGMHLFSRLPLVSPQVRYLIEEDVPSIKTGIRLPSGARIDLYGLHPKPPPLQDTAERDAELVLVGREVHESEVPSIVAGDLNDVAWSATTRLFQKVGGLLDPRVGRGTYATFNAHWPLLKWPLDHVFFHDSFQLQEMDVLEDIGSDHFPVFISLCFNPGEAAKQDAPRPAPNDLEKADEMVEEGREEEAEDDRDED